jgi:hypothetical protein
MLVFLVILAVGFVFVWARGDLEWVRPKPEIPVLNRNILKSEQTTEKASDLQPAESTKQ